MMGSWKLTTVRILVAVLLLLSIGGATATRAVGATTYQVSGKVTDQSANPIVGATVAAIDPASSTTVASTTTDSNGSYTLSVASGTYNVQVTPPSGSGFQTSTVNNQTISANTTLNVVLVPAGAVTLSGRVLDEQGNGIPGQTVSLYPAGGGSGLNSITDSTGRYSFQVAAGNYTIQLGTNNPATVNAPQNYYLQGPSGPPISLTQDTTLDLTLPAKRVQVHVQDAAGNAIANTHITTNSPSNGNLKIGTLTFYGYSDYYNNDATTDSAGNVTLWLFPTDPTNSSDTYTLSAVPPTGSPFAAFNVSNVSVTSDTSEVIALQFVHAPPVTTASVAPAPNAQGAYSNPVTVTLSATAASGFNIAATYYNVDGKATQTYSAPFAVSGAGTHTVKYWSVDNIGVYEITNTLTIKIASLAITTDSPLPDGVVGTSYSTTLQATGGTAPYTWTVAAGALPPGLTLDASTGVISGTPTSAGAFAFTVQVADSSSQTATKQFALAPPPPSGSADAPYSVPVSITVPSSDGGGSTSSCASGSYSVGGGTLPAGLTLDPTTGLISGTPADGGTYDVTVQCTTSSGQTASKDFTITINNPVPTISGIGPSSARAGDPDFTLTVTGINFVPSSSVSWNGANRTTTFVSATQLQAQITAADIASAGTANVSVVNPGPGGGSSDTATFTIAPADATSPTTTATVHGTQGSNNWYTSAVSVTLSAVDNTGGSGVATTYYAVDDATCAPGSTASCSTYGSAINATTDGTHTVYFFSLDKAGNVEAQQSVTFGLDQTSPGPTTMTLSGGTAGANGWYTASPSIALASSDATSKVAALYYQFVAHGSVTPSSPLPNSWTQYASAVTAPGDGDWDLYAYSVDNAGNQEAPVNLGEIKVDGTAPTVACGQPDGQWHASDVSIACSAQDATAGLASVSDASFSLSTTVPMSTETATASTGSHRVCDLAGNCATAGPIGGNMVDKAAPSVTCGAAPSTWQVHDVSISCTAKDDGSGLANATDSSFSLTTNVPAGSSTANATTGSHSVCDTVGNCATAGPIAGIKVDKEPPTVAYASHPVTYTVDQTVSITCTAADEPGGSGLASTTCQNISGPAYSYDLGTHTFTATATDVAGNVGQGSTSFSVQVTYGSLCNLTYSFVQMSAKYKSLPPKQQAAVTALATQLCGYLTTAQVSLTPTQKAQAIAAYQAGVQALVPLGWLAQSQATTLVTLSKGL